MSYNVGNIIEYTDIINVFKSSVVNTIIANAYDIKNPPLDGQYQCVPSSIMDSVDNIVINNIGTTGQRISASSIVNTLVSMTTNLTRVGTFTYVRRLHESYRVESSNDKGGLTQGEVLYDRYVEQTRKSGKVIFTTNYIRSLKVTPSNGGVVVNNPITISGINALCASCLSSWNSTDKYNYNYTNDVCHTVCHNNCHNNCYSVCYSNCYSD